MRSLPDRLIHRSMMMLFGTACAIPSRARLVAGWSSPRSRVLLLPCIMTHLAITKTTGNKTRRGGEDGTGNQPQSILSSTLEVY
jgi:hypothetical protein